MSNSKSRRRKQSSVDLQQIVTHVDVYNRPLNSSSGKSGVFSGLIHEAVVATVKNGHLFLIEKGVPQNDDVNYPIRYREGECRIAELVTQRLIQDWKLVRSVQEVNTDVTLEKLFDSCGDDFCPVTDNCWNGTQRMRVCANKSENGLSWQANGAIGGAVVVGLAVGIGAILSGALSGDSKDKDKKKETQKEAHKY